MSKYYIDRVDGRDNSNEQYVVIRVDLGAKDVHRNRKAVKKFCKILAGSNKGKSSIDASKEIKRFINALKKEEKQCPACKGNCEFEVSAGSHSFFFKNVALAMKKVLLREDIKMKANKTIRVSVSDLCWFEDDFLDYPVFYDEEKHIEDILSKKLYIGDIDENEFISWVKDRDKTLNTLNDFINYKKSIFVSSSYSGRDTMLINKSYIFIDILKSKYKEIQMLQLDYEKKENEKILKEMLVAANNDIKKALSPHFGSIKGTLELEDYIIIRKH